MDELVNDVKDVFCQVDWVTGDAPNKAEQIVEKAKSGEYGEESSTSPLPKLELFQDLMELRVLFPSKNEEITKIIDDVTEDHYWQSRD